MSVKSLFIATAIFSASLIGTTSVAHAAPLTQYASSVIDFSSQWGSSNWSAAQVLGAPNTFGYGDIPTAWAPSSMNGTLEYITVGFDTLVHASGATIRETSGNGFVYQIDAVDSFGNLHTVWNGVDTSAPGSPVDFTQLWDLTSYLVKGLKIYANTSHSGTWEEIDSIQLIGSTSAAIPEPSTVALLGLGLLGFAASRRKSKTDGKA